jgi:hypothetical protein
MNIKIVTEHTVSFTVEAFWNEEGGMGQDSFGGVVKELPEAVHLLELARKHSPKTNWVIVGQVKTSIT